MSEYDGHDDYDSEFEPQSAGTRWAGFFAGVFDLVYAAMAGLLIGRWTFFALGPSRDWAGLFALMMALPACLVGTWIAWRILRRTREADSLLRLGLRFGIVLVFMVAFAMPVVRQIE